MIDSPSSRTPPRYIKLVRLLSAALREDIVVGVFTGEGVEASVTFPCNGYEVDELFEDVREGTDVLFGKFPGRDNDAHAVSITLEDADGVVRGHPY